MNSETVLLRQIHPSFVQRGRVTSQAFRPTPKDEGQLSVYDGDRIGPQPAWEHYTGTLDCQSIGIMGVTVVECANLQLKVESDPKPFPEHVLIDYSGFAKTAIEKKAKLLKAKAIERDWIFRASAELVSTQT